MRHTVKITVLIAAIALGSSVVAQQSLPSHDELAARLVTAAVARSKARVRYDPAYVRIPYPNGDVPADTGVCTDEIIRIYRQVGIDLQKDVHEDMVRELSAYPIHGRRPDSNIDHRRVPNLMVFFRRNGESLPITAVASDYHPGDIVAWDLGGGVTHIGMVVDQRNAIMIVDRKNIFGTRYKILHNIGAGPQIEDVLFGWKIIGHYRYYGRPVSR